MLRKFGLFSALACAVAATPPAAEEHYVLMMKDGYFPEHLRPEIGDTIRFINVSDLPMSATATDDSWDTGILAPKQHYVLIVHDQMKRSFQNSVRGNLDSDGHPIGLAIAGSIDYFEPEMTTRMAIRQLY